MFKNGGNSTLHSLSAHGGKNTGGIFQRAKSMLPSLSRSSIIAGVFIIILIGIGIYFYYSLVLPKMKPKYKANNEIKYNSGDGSGVAEIMFFYVDWCPHCKTAKPEWENFKNSVQNTTVNGYIIQCLEINCTNETAEIESLIKKYKIEGYPTIKMEKDGQVIDFDAKVTENNLMQFVRGT